MNRQAHHIPLELPDQGKKTIAHWAFRPAGKVVIFVHGFGGHSVTSWISFSTLLREKAECAGHDIIFWGYDGLYAQAEFSATLLHSFLRSLLADPLSIINSSLPPGVGPRRKFKFTEITLIAHSLGAVICRRALLIAHEQGDNWVHKTKMVLFAPAHMGAHITNLSSLLTGPVYLAYGLFKARFQVVYDLEPGSPTLTKLLDDSKDVINTGQGAFAIARKVIWAERDNIVKQLQFANDPLPRPYPGKNHKNVCKPNSLFTDPVKDVIEVIK
jgi:pimeloyl-ACP methyl ester carboxylesterase